MNILVFSWRDPKHPLAGGAEQVMHEHMKGWINAGHEVTVFASHFKNAPRIETLDKVMIYRYGYQLLGVHIVAAIWYLFLKKQKYDLVIDQFHGIPFFTPLYIRAKKIAVLQEVAKEVWLMNHLPSPFNFIIGYLGYFLEPFFFLFYKRMPFMVGSDSAKDDLIKFGIPKNQITVVPHGVVIHKLNRKLEKEKIPTILFLGALAKDKGIEDALVAFSDLSKKGKFKFWIAGQGSQSYINFLKKLVDNLNIKEDTKFWGYVSEEQKFELLKRAHLLINPSFREGWGLVNIEANEMGTPVVAYKSAGLIDSVKNKESGLLCKENTPQEIAELAISLLSDKNYYEKMCESSFKWSKNFSWNKSKKTSLELLEKISNV